MNKNLYWFVCLIINIGTGTIASILSIKLVYTVIISIALACIWIILFLTMSTMGYNKTHVKHIP